MRVWAHLHLPRLLAWREGRGDDRVISVKALGSKIDYESALVLADVQFTVSERGRQRCLSANVRNVHAWVVGERVSARPHLTRHAKSLRKAVYDPWRGPTFVDADSLEPVHTAALAVMIGKDVWYEPTCDPWT